MTKDELKAIPFLKAEIASIRGTPRENEIPKLQAEVDRLEGWIDELPGNVQTIFRLYFIDGKTEEETAYIVGYDKSVISRRIKKYCTQNNLKK